MDFDSYLEQEWKPALGCTEPASIAWATAVAAEQSRGAPKSVHLICDPRIYKNCFAVGIPHSGHRTGIRWALAIGAALPNASLGLECFRDAGDDVMSRARELVEAGAITVDVDSTQHALYIDSRVCGARGSGRAVVEGTHTGLVRVESDGDEISGSSTPIAPRKPPCRAGLTSNSFQELLAMARRISSEHRAMLSIGIEYNLAIAEHGLRLFPGGFVDSRRDDVIARIGGLVCAGVYARMSGEDFVVMSLAGSGNKGITVSVPIAMWGEATGESQARIQESLALACLVTSMVTEHLGTLSAVCGCANAAGIGLAAGLVYLQGGDAEQVSLAVRNMVGNVSGMICDGAKIGCALKTLTAVDAAFRAATLAQAGVGIPPTDGIIGHDDRATLGNLGRIATNGMTAMDSEILRIMQDKPDAERKG
jgi:L-cysteine desulfidase